MPIRSLLLPVLLFIAGCGASREAFTKRESSAVRPVAVLVEKVLSGPVLGQPLRHPYGVAVDRTGTMYLVDAGNNRLIKFNDSLHPTREIGGFGSEPGLFDQPTFLVVDNDLTVLVTDSRNRRLTRFSSRMNYIDEIVFSDEEDALKFGYPAGVALTDYGEAWVTDHQNNRIAVFDNAGQFDRFVGDYGYDGGQLSSPEKLLRQANRQFVVCDAGNRRLVFYDEYGNFVTSIEDEALSYPVAAAVDRHKRLWVVDHNTSQLLCFDTAGARLLRIGPILPGNDRPMKQPSDIAVLPGGRLVISDSGNNRLLVCRVIEDQS